MYKLELTNVDKTLLWRIEEIVEENGCRIDFEMWRSIYNSYVVYDYEPFCSDGFNLCLIISSDKLENIHFVEWLINKTIDEIDSLEKLLKL